VIPAGVGPLMSDESFSCFNKQTSAQVLRALRSITWLLSHCWSVGWLRLVWQKFSQTRLTQAPEIVQIYPRLETHQM